MVELGSKYVQEPKKTMIAKKYPREHAQNCVFQNGGHRTYAKNGKSVKINVGGSYWYQMKGIDE